MTADPLRAATRRAAQRQAQQPRPQRLRYLATTVTSIATGAGTDGGDVVSFTDGTDTIAAPNLGDITAVGQQITVVFVDGAPLILGRRRGFPAL